MNKSKFKKNKFKLSRLVVPVLTVLMLCFVNVVGVFADEDVTIVSSPSQGTSNTTWTYFTIEEIADAPVGELLYTIEFQSPNSSAVQVGAKTFYASQYERSGTIKVYAAENNTYRSVVLEQPSIDFVLGYSSSLNLRANDNPPLIYNFVQNYIPPTPTPEPPPTPTPGPLDGILNDVEETSNSLFNFGGQMISFMLENPLTIVLLGVSLISIFLSVILSIIKHK